MSRYRNRGWDSIGMAYETWITYDKPGGTPPSGNLLTGVTYTRIDEDEDTNAGNAAPIPNRTLVQYVGGQYNNEPGGGDGLQSRSFYELSIDDAPAYNLGSLIWDPAVDALDPDTPGPSIWWSNDTTAYRIDLNNGFMLAVPLTEVVLWPGTFLNSSPQLLAAVGKVFALSRYPLGRVVRISAGTSGIIEAVCNLTFQPVGWAYDNLTQKLIVMQESGGNIIAHVVDPVQLVVVGTHTITGIDPTETSVVNVTANNGFLWITSTRTGPTRHVLIKVNASTWAAATETDFGGVFTSGVIAGLRHDSAISKVFFITEADTFGQPRLHRVDDTTLALEQSLPLGTSNGSTSFNINSSSSEIVVARATSPGGPFQDCTFHLVTALTGVMTISNTKTLTQVRTRLLGWRSDPLPAAFGVLWDQSGSRWLFLSRNIGALWDLDAATANPIDVAWTLGSSASWKPPTEERPPPTVITEAAYPTPYKMGATDRRVHVSTTTSASYSVKLPDPYPGRRASVKDKAGTAAIRNIIVDGDGQNIDGLPTFTINVNKAGVDFIYDGTEWAII